MMFFKRKINKLRQFFAKSDMFAEVAVVYDELSVNSGPFYHIKLQDLYSDRLLGGYKAATMNEALELAKHHLPQLLELQTKVTAELPSLGIH